MAGLVPAIPLRTALCSPKRDARHKAGHDGGERPAKNMTMIQPFLVALTAVVTLVVPTMTLAAWPERTITLIVPFAPGGANDVVARVIQQPLADALGQTIVIENRGGAGGSVGTGFAARAEAGRLHRAARGVGLRGEPEFVR